MLINYCWRFLEKIDISDSFCPICRFERKNTLEFKKVFATVPAILELFLSPSKFCLPVPTFSCHMHHVFVDAWVYVHVFFVLSR